MANHQHSGNTAAARRRHRDHKGGRHRATSQDTTHWCSGKPGKAHTPVVRSWAQRYGAGWECGNPWVYDREAAGFVRDTTTWRCWEEWACRDCGKTLGALTPDECRHRHGQQVAR